jgi:hypothetical protein
MTFLSAAEIDEDHSDEDEEKVEDLGLEVTLLEDDDSACE